MLIVIRITCKECPMYCRPFNDKKSFIGTTRYASIAAHKGHEIGRKDDVESLFYVLIYLITGYCFKFIKVITMVESLEHRSPR